MDEKKNEVKLEDPSITEAMINRDAITPPLKPIDRVTSVVVGRALRVLIFLVLGVAMLMDSHSGTGVDKFEAYFGGFLLIMAVIGTHPIFLKDDNA
jgi:hypothetical protein